MNPLLLEILPLIRQGYCCSQLLVLMLLQSSGRENPALVRAMHGLCHGMGGAEASCGLLTGGACVLGCLAGRGRDDEQAHPSFVPLVYDYQQWFAGRTQAYGGSACFQVVRGLSADAGLAADAGAASAGAASAGAAPAWGGPPNPSLCGNMLAECWEKILSLLEEYEIPLEMPQ